MMRCIYRVAVVLDWEKPRIEIKGIFVGARVKRGHDWNNGDEDHTLVSHFIALFIYCCDFFFCFFLNW